MRREAVTRRSSGVRGKSGRGGGEGGGGRGEGRRENETVVAGIEVFAGGSGVEEGSAGGWALSIGGLVELSVIVLPAVATGCTVAM